MERITPFKVVEAGRARILRRGVAELPPEIGNPHNIDSYITSRARERSTSPKKQKMDLLRTGLFITDLLREGNKVTIEHAAGEEKPPLSLSRIYREIASNKAFHLDQKKILTSLTLSASMREKLLNYSVKNRISDQEVYELLAVGVVVEQEINQGGEVIYENDREKASVVFIGLE